MANKTLLRRQPLQRLVNLLVLAFEVCHELTITRLGLPTVNGKESVTPNAVTKKLGTYISRRPQKELLPNTPRAIGLGECLDHRQR